jgi:hypothetical protein
MWPSREGCPRVLVEARDDERRTTMVTAFEGRHYQVIDCEGPKHEGDHLCPVMEGERCPGAAHADVVVCDFDDSDPYSRGLPAAVVHELRAGASVIVQVAAPVADRYREELEGCRLLYRPVALQELLDAVAAALDDLADTPAPRPLRSHGPAWARSAGA